eukprot:15335626-Ditylum_brightwellii.AAC.1
MGAGAADGPRTAGPGLNTLPAAPGPRKGNQRGRGEERDWPKQNLEVTKRLPIGYKNSLEWF